MYMSRVKGKIHLHFELKTSNAKLIQILNQGQLPGKPEDHFPHSPLTALLRYNSIPYIKFTHKIP